MTTQNTHVDLRVLACSMNGGHFAAHPTSPYEYLCGRCCAVFQIPRLYQLWLDRNRALEQDNYFLADAAQIEMCKLWDYYNDHQRRDGYAQVEYY